MKVILICSCGEEHEYETPTIFHATDETHVWLNEHSQCEIKVNMDKFDEDEDIAEEYARRYRIELD